MSHTDKCFRNFFNLLLTPLLHLYYHFEGYFLTPFRLEVFRSNYLCYHNCVNDISNYHATTTTNFKSNKVAFNAVVMTTTAAATSSSTTTTLLLDTNHHNNKRYSFTNSSLVVETLTITNNINSSP